MEKTQMNHPHQVYDAHRCLVREQAFDLAQRSSRQGHLLLAHSIASCRRIWGGPQPLCQPNKLRLYAQSSRTSRVYSQPQDVADSVVDSAQEVIQGEHMGEIYDSLADRLLQVTTWLPKCRMWLVGIAGAPGSGKSTAASAVCQRINQQWRETQGGADVPEAAVVVPMDGFHYYRRELDAMENPGEAHARRGAPFTFNAAAFVDAVRRIRQEGEASIPSFDHGVGDPVEGGHEVLYSHRIVLVEGNYLLLEEEPWCQLHNLFDERWFIDVDLDTAMERVIDRQVSNGAPLEVALHRVASNDRPNAELIARTHTRADVVVPSLPFEETP